MCTALCTTALNFYNVLTHHLDAGTQIMVHSNQIVSDKQTSISPTSGGDVDS